ncbi:unnamed protein product [Calicophoron daubneyi]|uniref:Uncharacterized protein n=1 Tax=Calicophoron daubneyi TaxID=300641 RepID=A0AAV2SY91_CALDB
MLSFGLKVFVEACVKQLVWTIFTPIEWDCCLNGACKQPKRYNSLLTLSPSVGRKILRLSKSLVGDTSRDLANFVARFWTLLIYSPSDSCPSLGDIMAIEFLDARRFDDLDSIRPLLVSLGFNGRRGGSRFCGQPQGEAYPLKISADVTTTLVAGWESSAPYSLDSLPSPMANEIAATLNVLTSLSQQTPANMQCKDEFGKSSQEHSELTLGSRSYRCYSPISKTGADCRKT